MENNLLGVVLLSVCKFRVPNFKSAKQVARTDGISLSFYKKLFDDLLVLARDITRAHVFHVKEELCEWRHVSQTLDGTIKVTGISEVP